MATPKFDAISIEFSKMIGDPVILADSDGKILTANRRNTIVNKALFKLFNKYWSKLSDDINSFAEIFPELIKIRETDVSMSSSGISYIDIQQDVKNYKAIKSGFIEIDEIYLTRGKSSEYHIYRSKKHSSYIRSKDDAVLVDIPGSPGIAAIFPENLFNEIKTSRIQIEYVITPLTRAEGIPIIQGGNYDSPYNYTWLPEICEIAYELFRIDAQVI